MDDTDKTILDEVAEATVYLYKALISQQYTAPGMSGRVLSNEQAARMATAAVPGILQGRLGVLRVS